MEVSGSTSSMTSVPKPLKFLSSHYEPLKEYYNTLPESEFKVSFAHFNLLTKILARHS